jgi:uncharacterized repeat protein (TIGR02543 family)
MEYNQMKHLKRFGSIIMLSSLIISPETFAAGNIDTTDKYAWSENSGWVNFNDANGGVTVYDDHLEGYAWAENIGWVRLGTYTSGGIHTYANTSQTDYGVNNDGAGNLSGYAWSETAGWINFNPSDSQVTIDASTGDFDGYAWAENVGWIHFQNAAYKVRRLLSPNNDSFQVTKIGDGRGTVKAKVDGEDWTLICNSACQQARYDYVPNSKVILKANPANGFTFNGWNGDCSGTDNNITATMNATKRCTVEFTPNLDMLKLTIKKTGNGIVTSKFIDCGEICSAYYQPGKKVTLTATPDANNLFMGWTGACSGLNNRVRITMDAAKSCTASFKPHDINEVFALTVNNGGDGLGTISGRVKGESTSLICNGKKGCKQAQHEYTSGTQVILSAIPNDGFEFTDGSGDCPWESDVYTKGRLRASATVIMDQAKDCTTNFGLKTEPNMTWYEFTVYTAGTGNGSVNNPGRIECGNNCSADSYQEGDTFWLKAVPASLSKFIGWTGDSCESKGTSIKVTMSKNMTCTANFQSYFEIMAEEIVDAFYVTATSGDGTPAEIYPRAANKARLKEAFWLTIVAIIQVDQYLTISNNETWLTQFDSIEWLPSDSSAEYTHSVQILADWFIGIEVELIDGNGAAEEMGIVIYYGDKPPIIGDGSWGGSLSGIAFLSHYVFHGYGL